jgi:hypothetical protein
LDPGEPTSAYIGDVLAESEMRTGSKDGLHLGYGAEWVVVLVRGGDDCCRVRFTQWRRLAVLH